MPPLRSRVGRCSEFVRGSGEPRVRPRAGECRFRRKGGSRARHGHVWLPRTALEDGVVGPRSLIAATGMTQVRSRRGWP
jgi:hypothetical protein